MDLIKKIRLTILGQKLFRPGDTILLGVSGGPDSMALLSTLHSMRHELGIHIIAAHVNHQLRKGAKSDERLVQAYCHQLPCPFVKHRLNFTVKEKRSNLEDTARRKRYAALFRLARANHTPLIALGHQQDDVAETVLMHILRGSGLQGLQGILPKTTMGDFIVLRPLLSISRHEILQFLKKNRIPFRHDPSNNNVRFTRNKIRWQLLPLLARRYQRNIKTLLAQLAENVATDYEFIRKEGAALFKRASQMSELKGEVTLNLATFSKSPDSLQRMCLRLVFEAITGDLRRFSYIHVSDIKKLIDHLPSGSITNLPGDIRVKKTKSRLLFTRIKT
jgi:tRNA(Ile)-lysidine synthase